MVEEQEEIGILDRVGKSHNPNSPVQAPLKTIMKIDFIVNDKGQVWVVYDRPLPNSLDWIEYDLENDRLIFVGRGGVLHDYGEEVLPEVRTYLKRAQSAFVVRMENKKIMDVAVIKIIVRRKLH